MNTDSSRSTLKVFFIIWLIIALFTSLLSYLSDPIKESHWLGYYSWLIIGVIIYFTSVKRLQQAIINNNRDKLYFFGPTLSLIFIQAIFASWSRAEPLYQYLIHDFLIFGFWIVALWMTLTKYRVSKLTALIIIGLHGLLMEGVLFMPLGLLIAPMTMLFYWLMLYPSLKVIELKYSKTENQEDSHLQLKNIIICIVIPLLFIIIAQIIAILLYSMNSNLFSEYNF